ncbi:MAG: hypothetical protein ACREQ9_03545, partial [Candidatus Binatia bacterium]
MLRISLTIVAGVALWLGGGRPAGAGLVPTPHAAGAAHAELVRFEYFRPVVLTGVDSALAPADADVDTYGLPGGNSRARAGNGEIVLLGAIPFFGPAVAEQTAGDDNPE